jgi:hypothetical protein
MQRMRHPLEELGAPSGGPHPYQFARCWEKGFNRRACRCPVPAPGLSAQGARQSTRAAHGSALWARSSHAIAGRKVSEKARAVKLQQQGLGLQLTDNMVFGNADRAAGDDVASGNIL